MVQAQRMKLRIDQFKAKSDARKNVMAGLGPAIHESGRTVEKSRPISRTADVDGRDKPGHDERGVSDGPVSGLYFSAQAKGASIAPVFSADASFDDERASHALRGDASCIVPVNSRGGEQRRAA